MYDNVKMGSRNTNTRRALSRVPSRKLLRLRIRDLGLSVENSPIQTAVNRLYRELAGRGLGIFKPRVYLGDEWFSPDGVPAISVPFYLAHPRLRALEKHIMRDVEGDSPAYFMRLLRHEAGHCLIHAFKLTRDKEWKRLFGDPRQAYKPETYMADPRSKAFVRNLHGWYAQAHPEEDFAETFAVWLSPYSRWRVRYARWPRANAKLRYVDKLARRIASGAAGYPTPRMLTARENDLICNAERLKSTLARYYARRKKEKHEVRLR